MIPKKTKKTTQTQINDKISQGTNTHQLLKIQKKNNTMEDLDEEECCQQVYYPPAWGLMALVCFVLSVCLAVPAFKLEETGGSRVWLGIAIPVATAIYAVVFYAFCWRHLGRIEECLITGLKPAISAPTKEVRRAEKATFMIMSEMEHLRIALIEAEQNFLEDAVSDDQLEDDEEDLRNNKVPS